MIYFLNVFLTLTVWKIHRPPDPIVNQSHKGSERMRQPDQEELRMEGEQLS